MSYANEILGAGRRPITTATLTLDKCANTFGIAPCTASAATGLECFNSFGTCQDPANYDGSETLELVLTDAHADVLEAPVATPGEVYIPCIDSISIAPEKITPGKGLGHRGKVTLTCLDFPHHDLNTDPYVSTRTYTPVEQGTFFGKLLARNRHYVNRPLTVRQYFYGGGRTASDYRELHYILDKIDGPDAGGKYRISAKDPLVLTEAQKAQCPPPTTGTLLAGINDTVTTFSIHLGEEAEYPSGAHVLRINEELLDITMRSVNTFTVNARGHGGTEAVAHDADDQVQLCYVADGTSAARVDLIIAELLEDYADMPSAYISAATWATEAALWTSNYFLETIISEPTSVLDLLSEICVETNSMLWWSPSEQLIKWQANVPDLALLEEIDNSIVIGKLASTKRLEAERISQVLFYNGVRNWTESREASNYRALQVRIDTTGESSDAYQAPAIKKIFARWLQTVAESGEVASRYLARFKNPPEQVIFNLDLKDIDTVLVGDHVLLTIDQLPDVYGTPDTIEMQVLSALHDVKNESIKIDAMRFRYDGQRYATIGPDTLGDYTSESEINTIRYGFIADTVTEKMSNGDDPYVIL